MQVGGGEKEGGKGKGAKKGGSQGGREAEIRGDLQKPAKLTVSICQPPCTTTVLEQSFSPSMCILAVWGSC